ncbi:hypothetical protein [Desulfitobacterium hafniense]|nr:hypothetical protein [Desulfitobacterium hafniense]MEA5023310.1 hypothetical protein [Desulfitobacterium hafniense]
MDYVGLVGFPLVGLWFRVPLVWLVWLAASLVVVNRSRAQPS